MLLDERLTLAGLAPFGEQCCCKDQQLVFFARGELHLQGLQGVLPVPGWVSLVAATCQLIVSNNASKTNAMSGYSVSSGTL